jgi:hypothetical protein
MDRLNPSIWREGGESDTHHLSRAKPGERLQTRLMYFFDKGDKNFRQILCLSCVVHCCIYFVQLLIQILFCLE